MNIKKTMTTVLFSIIGYLFLISIDATEAFAYTYPNGEASKPGDILITRETNCTTKDECKGLSGHAAIVVDGTYFVHISGPKANPTKEKLSTWFKGRYGKKTKVVRATKHYDGSAQNAANWANKYVKDYKKAKYEVTLNSITLDKTYCSKLVWQAYNYGAKYPIIAKRYGGLIHPYDFSSLASGGRYAKLVSIYQNW